MPEVTIGAATSVPPNTAQARYSLLSSPRDMYLQRARANSKLTLPSLIPNEGTSSASSFYQAYQSVGANGVNNLASKLLLSMMPATAPFFRLDIDEFETARMAAEAGDDMVSEINKTLSLIERATMSDVAAKADSVTLNEALLHLIVGGNALLHDDEKEDAGLRMFSLEKYVCVRDGRGQPMEIVVKECLSPSTLPQEVQDLINNSAEAESMKDAEKSVEVYTWLRRGKSQWTVCQEVLGQKIPSSEGTYPLKAFPWYPLRMVRVSGEDYGRGYVDSYFGDLKSLDALSQAIVEGTAAAAKVLFLVNPNGTTTKETLAKAPNGAIRSGNAEDVSVLQLEKYNDFRVCLETMSRLETRLGHAFLLSSAVTRDAERVTAEEIRAQIQELQDALGGVYSLLTQEFQAPFIKTRLAILGKRKDWPKLPPTIKIRITSGLEALGRGHDRNRLLSFMDTINKTAGPEALQRYVHLSEAIKRLAIADGLVIDGLIKSKDEIAQEMQAAQMSQVGQTIGPELVKSISAQQQQAAAAPPPA